MSTALRPLLLIVALIQFTWTALPPGNEDLIGVQSAALDLSRGDREHLYPGRDFQRNREWVEHSARNHRDLGDTGEPQWLMYPPLYPWLFSPIAPLGAEAWRLIWALLQLGVLFLLLTLIERWLKHSAGVNPDRLLIAALLLGSYPIARVFQLGQTSLLLAFALWGALYWSERNHTLRAPIILGLAVFIKPFLFIVEIARLMDRKWKRFVTTAFVFALLTLSSILFVGWQPQIEYIEFLRTLSGSQTAYWGNQSLSGAGLRLFSDLPVMCYGFEPHAVPRPISLAILFGFLITAAVVQHRSRVRHPIATPAMWITAALLGLSLSWEHHAILLLPAVAFLWTRKLTPATATALVAATLFISVNLTPLFEEAYPGRALACLPAIGRLILFVLLVLYHFEIDSIHRNRKIATA